MKKPEKMDKKPDKKIEKKWKKRWKQGGQECVFKEGSQQGGHQVVQ